VITLRTKFQIVLPLLALSLVCASGWAKDKPTSSPKTADRIIVMKSAHKMTLMRAGQVLKTYKVALGDSAGTKRRKGDRETPEGEYTIDAKNLQSRFHRALHISYPSAADRERARTLGANPGGDIEIHGLPSKQGWLGFLHRQVDWTSGCIAVTNSEIEEIYPLVPVGTPIEIKP
jgi:murein L,D-transpeptidase YafK